MDDLKIGQHYWTVYLNVDTGFEQVIKATYCNDMVDQRRKNEGRIFATSQDADAYLKTL